MKIITIGIKKHLPDFTQEGVLLKITLLLLKDYFDPTTPLSGLGIVNLVIITVYIG